MKGRATVIGLLVLAAAARPLDVCAQQRVYRVGYLQDHEIPIMHEPSMNRIV